MSTMTVLNSEQRLGGMTEEVANGNQVLGTLRDHLQDWTTWQEASFQLGILCGVYPPTLSYAQHCAKYGSWWYKGNLKFERLSDCLDTMARAGILERIDDGDYKFRWTPQQLPAQDRLR